MSTYDDGYAAEEMYEDEDPYAESYIALLDPGMDENNVEALEYAADIIQCEGEIYYAHQRAHQAGLRGFGGYAADRGKSKGKGKMTPDEKRMRIEQLKKRTTCRRCGQTGHWSPVQPWQISGKRIANIEWWWKSKRWKSRSVDRPSRAWSTSR